MYSPPRARGGRELCERVAFFIPFPIVLRSTFNKEGLDNVAFHKPSALQLVNDMSRTFGIAFDRRHNMYSVRSLCRRTSEHIVDSG